MDPLASQVLQAARTHFPEREGRALDAWSTAFFPYQQNWLFDPSRFAVVLKSRQIGASHTYAAAATLWALWGEHTNIISVGEREAIDVLQKATAHAEVLHKLGSQWAKPRATKTEVTLASGGTITALPSTSAGRGKSGNVILDESAYHQHPKEVWDGAAATTLLGFRLRVISTPNGVGNLFHDLWSNPKANRGYRKHFVSLDDAMADGLEVDLDDCWKMARGDPRVFDQLFRGKFLDGDAQYISSELVDACTEEDTFLVDGEVFAGLDIGRTADRTEMVILKRDVDGVCWVQERLTCKRTSSLDLEAFVVQALNMGARRICVDETGMGAFPVEDLQRKFGRHRIEGVTFTQDSKEDLATTLYTAFANRTIRLRRSDTTMRDDVCSIRRIVTSAGNIRYDAPHTDAGHADSAWALALALHACSGRSRVKYDLTA